MTATVNPRLAPPWTDEEKAELRRMALDGVPDKVAARRLGRTPEAVGRVRRINLGIYRWRHPNASKSA